MAHCLIIGQTLSGKSSLSKRLAARYKANGVGVLVFDPVGDPEWSADYKTHKWADFWDAYKNSRRCAIFVDEARIPQVEAPHQIDEIATRGRHRGHRAHFIVQRTKMLAPTPRNQCSELFIFSTGRDDAKELGAEWNEPTLHDVAPNLRVGEYIHKRRMHPMQRGYLFAGQGLQSAGE